MAAFRVKAFKKQLKAIIIAYAKTSTESFDTRLCVCSWINNNSIRLDVCEWVVIPLVFPCWNINAVDNFLMV